MDRLAEKDLYGLRDKFLDQQTDQIHTRMTSRASLVPNAVRKEAEPEVQSDWLIDLS